MHDTDLTDARWHPLIAQNLKDSFYHQSAWLALITRIYGFSLTLLTSTNTSGQLTGVLPLCAMESPLTGRRLVGLPFSDLCPLIATDDASAGHLVEQAVEQARKQRARYLELRTGSHHLLAQRRDLIAGNLYVRWLLPLSTDSDAHWSQLRKPVQRQIKKSRNQGVQVRVGEQPADIERYYQLHLRTRSRLGMPAQPRRYFSELWDAFAPRGMLHLLLAEYQGATIAGMILLASGSIVKYAYGASDDRYLHLSPNNLLLWTAITWGCTHGYQTLDLGRTACDNQGLMEYKRRWGAIQEALPYYYYPHIQGLAATPESSKTYHLLTACWRRLPLQLAGPLGGYLYRHLG